VGPIVDELVCVGGRSVYFHNTRVVMEHLEGRESELRGISSVL